MVICTYYKEYIEYFKHNGNTREYNMKLKRNLQLVNPQLIITTGDYYCH